MRIAALAKRTDTPKETIHYYLRIGLLKKPKKTSKNMAYYDESHVEQLKLIKRLRTESYLPIEIIKKVLREDRLAASVRKADLAGDLFGASAKAEIEAVGPEELARRSGLSIERIEAYEKAGLIRSKDGRYRWEDARIAEILDLAESEAGEDLDALVLERFSILERHVADLVRDEASHFFARVLAGGDPTRAMELLRGGKETIGRFLALSRVRRLRDELESLFSEVEAAFRARGFDNVRLSKQKRVELGEEERFSQLLAELEANPEEPRAARALFEHLLFAGFAADVAEMFEGASEKIRKDARVRSLVGQALSECRRFEEAAPMLQEVRRTKSDVGLEVAHAACLLGRLEIELGGAAEADSSFMPSAELIQRLGAGLTALLGGKSAKANSRAESFRTRFLSGRIELSTPTFLGLKGAAIRDLRSLLEEIKSVRGTAEDPGYGIMDTIELNALMALASVVRNDEERVRYERRAKEIDPKPEVQAPKPARTGR